MDVCDKVDVNSRDPFLDSSYYSSFVYTLLDGSGEEISFDSTPAKDPTGEVQVHVKDCLWLIALHVEEFLFNATSTVISCPGGTAAAVRISGVSHCSVQMCRELKHCHIGSPPLSTSVLETSLCPRPGKR